MKRSGVLLLPLFFSFFLFYSSGTAGAGPWIPLSGAVHVHSREFSSGDHSIGELIDMARKRDVDVIVLTDHDRISMSYGFPPFRNLFSVTRSRNSVLKRGAKLYLETVNRIDAETPDVLLIPALESSPFYYWSGSFWKGTLTAHDWRKHIHLVGLTDPDVIEHLPLPGNGFSTRCFSPLLPRFLVFIGGVLLSLTLILQGGFLRKAGRVFLVLGILGAMDSHPFKSSRFDPFHGDRGAAPYQEMIDYVNAHGGMTFWAHPEARYGDREVVRPRTIAGIHLPGIRMRTGVHPEDLLRTRRYTGFEALYGDTIHATDPGHEWDRELLEYCNGTRDHPAWGLCGIDFHREGQNSWSELDRGQTVFWARERSRAAVLAAMRSGRMYAVYQGGGAKLRLDTFNLASGNGEPAVSGEEVSARGKTLHLRLSLALSDRSRVPLEVTLIDSGRVVDRLVGSTPFLLDREMEPGRSFGYFRVDVRAKRYRLLSNPIFYKRTS